MTKKEFVELIKKYFEQKPDFKVSWDHHPGRYISLKVTGSNGIPAFDMFLYHNFFTAHQDDSTLFASYFSIDAERLRELLEKMIGFVYVTLLRTD